MTATLIERAAVVALLLHGSERGLGSWTALAGELLDTGSGLGLLRQPAGQQELFAADADAQLVEATELLRRWVADGIGVHSVLDDAYPALLRDIRERPPILFTRGKAADDQRAIASATIHARLRELLADSEPYAAVPRVVEFRDRLRGAIAGLN